MFDAIAWSKHNYPSHFIFDINEDEKKRMYICSQAKSHRLCNKTKLNVGLESLVYYANSCIRRRCGIFLLYLLMYFKKFNDKSHCIIFLHYGLGLEEGLIC